MREPRMYQPAPLAAPVVMAATETPSLLSIASHLGRAACTLGIGVDEEVPLPEPEGEHEWVDRPGFGWVERLVEVEPVEVAEAAAA